MGLKELLEKQMKGEVFIVDVRNEDEHTAHNPLSSINIPLSSLHANPEQIQTFDKQVVLVCFSGRRSEMAQEAIKNILGLHVDVLENGLQTII